jgi:hypothetical protein
MMVFKFEDVPLQCLGDLAVSTPKLLIPHFNDIFTLCSTTVSNPEKDDSYRHSKSNQLVNKLKIFFVQI